MNLRQMHDKEGRGYFVLLAKKVGTVPAYLSQCANGVRKPSPQMAQRLAAADRRLKLPDLLPDVYGKPA